MYMRSRSSLGREVGCDVVDGALVEGWRRRTGRLGVCGGASSMAVSEEPLLPVEERDRDRGVEARDAISSDLGRVAVVLCEGASHKSGVSTGKRIQYDGNALNGR
jgi:hypothetical protein